MKCGFAGENFPTSVFPCVVGRPLLRYEESLMEQQLKVRPTLWLFLLQKSLDLLLAYHLFSFRI